MLRSSKELAWMGALSAKSDTSGALPKPGDQTTPLDTDPARRCRWSAGAKEIWWCRRPILTSAAPEASSFDLTGLRSGVHLLLWKEFCRPTRSVLRSSCASRGVHCTNSRTQCLTLLLRRCTLDVETLPVPLVPVTRVRLANLKVNTLDGGTVNFELTGSGLESTGWPAFPGPVDPFQNWEWAPLGPTSWIGMIPLGIAGGPIRRMGPKMVLFCGLEKSAHCKTQFFKMGSTHFCMVFSTICGTFKKQNGPWHPISGSGKRNWAFRHFFKGSGGTHLG